MDKQQVFDNYHKWYFEAGIQGQTKWRGITCLKTTSDLWNYQEIIVERNVSLVVEFGTYWGGSTLFFLDLLDSMGGNRKLLGVDSALGNITRLAVDNPKADLMECSSVDPKVAVEIQFLRGHYPGPMFVILDSDHSKDHVLAEMESLRSVMKAGDYLIVEDSNIAGNPVYGEWPDGGPYAARAEYFERYPEDYMYDTEREEKFGFTYSPKGYLIKR